MSLDTYQDLRTVVDNAKQAGDMRYRLHIADVSGRVTVTNPMDLELNLQQIVGVADWRELNGPLPKEVMDAVDLHFGLLDDVTQPEALEGLGVSVPLNDGEGPSVIRYFNPPQIVSIDVELLDVEKA